MHTDVDEPLPPTEDVLSGMDEDFHPDGGSSEGKLSAAVPFCLPVSVLLMSADVGCYLDVRGVVFAKMHKALLIRADENCSPGA